MFSDSILKKYRLFIFPKSSSSPNKHIFVRGKTVCLLWEKCLLWVCLLWEGKVFFRYRELKTLSDSSSTIVYFPKLRMRLKVDESIYRFIFKRNLCHMKIWKKLFSDIFILEFHVYSKSPSQWINSSSEKLSVFSNCESWPKYLII